MLKLFAELQGKLTEVPIKSWDFPGGETGLRIDLSGCDFNQLWIDLQFRSNSDLIDMLMMVNAIRNSYPLTPIYLNCNYFPYARQDRVMVEGEAAAVIVIAQLIASCNFKMVQISDPHSDVTVAALTALGVSVVVETQAEVLKEALTVCNKAGKMALVSPDAGASKKVYASAKQLGCKVFEAFKQRDPATGQIVKTLLTDTDFSGYDCLVVVDDICDGGRTFVELAKAIREAGYTKELRLCVTHGIFSAGLQPLECYDKIYAAYSRLDTELIDQFNTRKERNA